MEIKIEGNRYTESILRRVQAETQGKIPFRRAIRLAGSLGFLVICLVLYDVFDKLFFVAIGCVPLMSMFFFKNFWTRRFMNNSALMNEKIHGVISEDRITIDIANGGSWSNWNRFVRAKIEDDLVFMYMDKMLCLPFPRTLFASESDWTAFTEMVRAKVPIKYI